MKTSLTIVTFPIQGRRWLFSTWTEQVLVEGASKIIEDKTAWERFTANTSERAMKYVSSTWKKCEDAKEGTLMNRAYKFGLWVLEREDANEAFLKGMPPKKDIFDAHVNYPNTIDQRLVRRRLRLLTKKEEVYWFRALGWGLVSVPLSILALTPISNFPVYYTLYKTYSAYSAYTGANALRHLLDYQDKLQGAQLAMRVLDQRRMGALPKQGKWTQQLLQKQSDVVMRASWPGSHPTEALEETKKSMEREGSIFIEYFPDGQLTELVQPEERTDKPIDEKTLEEVSIDYGDAIKLQGRRILKKISSSQNK